MRSQMFSDRTRYCWPLSSFVETSPMQTLATLDLWNNDIGPQGAQDLAGALEQNKVALSQCFIHVFTVYTQALATLNLGMNQIGLQGAHALANALKINRVGLSFSFFSLRPSVRLRRRSPCSTFGIIESDRRALGILPMHCKRTP